MITTVSPSFSGTLLKNGSTGSEVARVQTYLNALRGTGLRVDGIYGSKTVQAVRAFQQASGLAADGTVGRATWNALIGQYNARFGGSADTYPGIALRNGLRGQDVLRMQQHLNVIANTYTAVNKQTEDGIHGANMTNAVRRFQKQHGLTADGIVGPATWNKIVAVRGRNAAVTTPFERNLSVGSSGDAVRFVQSYLSAAGYPVAVDGVFGSRTGQAVRSFQQAKGLKADGIVGRSTHSALVQAFNNTL